MDLGVRLVLFVIFVIGLVVVIASLFLPLGTAFNYLVVGLVMVIFSLVGMTVYRFFFR